jgi:hypothetical protein
MSWPLPISYLQLNVFWAIMAVGAVALIWTFMRSRRSGDAARKGKRSTVGILVQSLGFAAAGFGGGIVCAFNLVRCAVRRKRSCSVHLLGHGNGA